MTPTIRTQPASDQQTPDNRCQSNGYTLPDTTGHRPIDTKMHLPTLLQKVRKTIHVQETTDHFSKVSYSTPDIKKRVYTAYISNCNYFENLSLFFGRNHPQKKKNKTVPSTDLVSKLTEKQNTEKHQVKVSTTPAYSYHL